MLGLLNPLQANPQESSNKIHPSDQW